MREWTKELLALMSLMAVLVGLPLAIWGYERHLVAAASRAAGNARVLEITGLSQKGCGCWTDEKIAGWNYWWKNFRHAHFTVRQGQKVLLRLTSSDVVHSFAIPQLRIRPVEVEPGRVTLVEFTAEEPDSLTYTCYTVCGQSHSEMMGIIVVEPTIDRQTS